MAIVKMKKLLIMAAKSQEKELLEKLLLLGCVEVDSPEKAMEDEEIASLVGVSSGDLTELRAQRAELQAGLSILDRYAPEKRGMFARKPEVTAETLIENPLLDDMLEFAGKIDYFDDQIRRVNIEQNRQRDIAAMLEPWASVDLPLEFSGTESCDIILGTAPVNMDFHEMKAELALAAEEAELIQVNADGEQMYLILICLRRVREQALAAVRAFGFALAGLPESGETPAMAILRAKASVEELEIGKAGLTEMIVSGAKNREAIELSLDTLATKIERAEAAEKLMRTDYTVILDGWAPAGKEKELAKLLDEYGCAWEMREPEPEEYPEVPVTLKNNWFTRPLNMVTEMYSLPAYGSLDPNPLMAPFFILFYGIMMADMGYGILMMLGCLFMIGKMRVKGGMRNFAGLLGLCGVSTFIVGAMTGGFFGDLIPQMAKLIDPDTTLTALPALFTPLNDTIAILIGSLVLGFIQIITGMIISVVSKIRNGDFIDALFNEITWWIILAGAALAIFGIGSVAGVPVVLAVGVLMLAVGGTRNAKGFGKVTSFIGLVYNGVSGFFSDTLSYARIMALMLAGSVIAQVFNTLGSVTGNIVAFLIISMVGNALNFALNLLGCYVHDLRLQCLEFFNRFYQEGGKPFAPLSVKTKYIDVYEHN